MKLKKNNNKFSLRFQLFVLIFFFLAVFTRFYNIDYTARFTQDESSDLARMHAYWQEKKLTLVGPIATDNSKIFGSLTYYMQMPFAVMYNFAPVGPAMGTAFWGIITITLLLFLKILLSARDADDSKKYSLFKQLELKIQSFFKKNNNKNLELSTLLFALIILFWPPLLLTSRWAWNPHLIAFWVSLALLINQLSFKGKYVLVGLFLGLTIHHHYLAIFAIGTFGVIEFIKLFRSKKYSEMGQLLIGYVLALLPFAIFDIRHPPGLFFSRYLQADMSYQAELESVNIFANLIRNFSVSLNEIVHLKWLQILFVLGLTKLIWLDFKKSRTHLLLLLPVLAQILGCVFIGDFLQRYFLPAIVFFLAWLAQPRKKTSLKLSNFLMILIIISSVLQLENVLTKPIMSPPMRVVTQAQQAIVEILANNPDIKNYNIAALTARDLDSLGLKYRDLLSINGITFRAASEYDLTENLLVVTDVDEAKVRQDQNVAMSYFKESRLRQEYLLEEKPWRVYWFSY